MADSYRLTVLKRLTALIEATAVSPYPGMTLPSTLNGLVFRGRKTFGDNDPDLMVSILEDVRDRGALYAEDRRNEQWSLLMQAWMPDDKVNPSDPLYSLADDIERQLDRVTATNRSIGTKKYPEHYMLGPDGAGTGYLINSFQVNRPFIRPPTEGVSSKSFLYIPLLVGLARISVE